MILFVATKKRETTMSDDRSVCHDTFTTPLTIFLTACVHIWVSKMYSITTILNWNHMSP
jgi:hypothetical protein